MRQIHVDDMSVDILALIYQRGADQNLGVHRNLWKSRHLSFQLDFDFGLG